MIKLHFRITWPALILILIALAVWLMRDPAPRKPAPRRRPQPRKARPDSRRPFVIHQTPDGDDYTAETERLDREAAESARTVFEESEAARETVIEELKTRDYTNRTRR